MPLIKGGEVVADGYARVTVDDAIPANGALLVDLALFRQKRDELLARGGNLGVSLASDEPPSELESDLGHLSLVALEFPAFRDGRAFSYARLLRERLGFTGEIRAVGDVLAEQLHFLDRCGFDAFEVSDSNALELWNTASKEFDVWYQPTGDGRPTAMARRRAPGAAPGPGKD